MDFYEALDQVVDLLQRRGCLAAAALFWVTSDRPILGERRQHARKIIRKIFHWQSAPGKTCEGFLNSSVLWAH